MRDFRPGMQGVMPLAANIGQTAIQPRQLRTPGPQQTSDIVRTWVRTLDPCCRDRLISHHLGIEKAKLNHIPLTQKANLVATHTLGQGLPAGPYLPAQYGSDQKQFPD